MDMRLRRSSGSSREGSVTEEVREHGSLIVPSLAIANMAAYMLSTIVSLLLVDIAQSFAVPVGIAGQLQTGMSIAGIAVALLLAALSIRFSRKSLLIAGLVFLGVAALGCSVVHDFTVMLLIYSIGGFGLAMVTPMANAIVGERLPVEKRGSALGWIIAGGALTYLIVGTVVAFLGNWRLLFQALVLPTILVSLLLVFTGIPYATRKTTGQTSDYFHGFKEVFSNRSVIACLTSTALCIIVGMAITVYSASFYRQRFLLSREQVSVVIMVLVPVYVAGSLAAGRLVNKYGRKSLSLLAALAIGALTIAFYNVPNLWLSLALASVAILFAGMRLTAGNSLTLEQVPAFRGTVMSINQAAMSVGQSIGLGIGGLILLLSDYYALGTVLGSMGIVAAVVYHFLAVDPTKTQPQSIKT